jgi:RND family efflux transporter MFP subunit
MREKGMTHDASAPPPETPPRRSRVVMGAIGAVTLGLIALGAVLYVRSRSRVNDVALASVPKAVAVVEAVAGTYRPERHYVATLDPWVLADVGPQLIAAYTATVLVRPGDHVTRGQVLATLDCRESSATNRAVAMQAQAIEAKQKALANESSRVNSLLDGGFVAPNEAEQKLATSESQLAELMATQAKLVGTSLAVSDCILRSPFDGEVSRRLVDPGAFVRPGTAIASVIDRSTIRVTAEVPESDFAIVNPGTPVKIKILSTGYEAIAVISRRSPAASTSTRTVHFEIDLPDPERKIPVGATADLTIAVGKPEVATIVPGIAASVRSGKATLFVVEGDKAKKVIVPVKGEVLGTLYCDTSLASGARVVTEGRSLLADGDKVMAELEAKPDTSATRPVSAGSKP